MELDLPTPVSRPPSLEMHLRTTRHTHPSNTRQKSAEKQYAWWKTDTLIYPDPREEHLKGDPH